MHACLFCNSTAQEKYSFQEEAVFNEKIWGYVRCRNCRLVSLSPLPGAADLQKMYGSSYHEAYYFKGDPYSISYYEHLLNRASSKTVLDYGCGDGAFLRAIKRPDTIKVGVEYDPELVLKLKSFNPQMKFYSTDEFSNSHLSFDIIHLGDVLEHSVNPRLLLHQLKERLHQDGFLIVDGPLEANPNVAYACRRIAQRLKFLFGLHKARPYVPYHITFSDSKNQLDLFEKTGLETVAYKIYETPWPYPDRSGTSFFENCKYFVARVSVLLSRRLPWPWGNRFIYVGKKRAN